MTDEAPGAFALEELVNRPKPRVDTTAPANRVRAGASRKPLAELRGGRQIQIRSQPGQSNMEL
jgi:hypothetical protein